MEVKQLKCSECNSAVATMKCNCQMPPVYLCDKDLFNHFDKYTKNEHKMVSIRHDLPDGPEDDNQEDLTKLYVQAILFQCENFKSDAIRYIEDRVGILHAFRDNFSRIIEQELVMCNRALHSVTKEIEKLIHVVRITPRYEDLVAIFGIEITQVAYVEMEPEERLKKLMTNAEETFSQRDIIKLHVFAY